MIKSIYVGKAAMTKYIIKRLGMALIVAFLVTTFIAVMPSFVPGDPIRTILGPRASTELVNRLRDEMGINEPIYIQVISFIKNALRGDLGKDIISGIPVTMLIKENLFHTLILAFSSLLLAFIIGLPLGILSAVKPDGFVDRFVSLISVSFVTVPPFVSGLLLLLLFSVKFRWFPAIGAGDWSDPAAVLSHLVLPAFTLALTWIGYLSRLIRTSILEVMTTNYVKTSIAFGIRDWLIYYKYALKNAIIPTISVVGNGLGSLLGGAIYVEVIFSRPGLGRLIYSSIQDRNYPIVRGGILVVALMFVMANLLADLSYRFIDPRLRNGNEGF
jgi:peptide/nickel transport system permease protein